MAGDLDRVFALGSRIRIIPIIHGSADCAVEVRRRLLARRFDCLAVPLPPSFQSSVEAAIDFLPSPCMVTQRATGYVLGDAPATLSYVPIDPCQGVIAALRLALQERVRRAFIDLETDRFQPVSRTLPDPYALKQAPLERFAAAVLPSLGPLPAGQPQNRVEWMAQRLRELERRYESIVLVCSLTDWPWIVNAYLDQNAPTAEPDEVEPDEVEDVQAWRVDPESLLFLLGELPFVTALHERARAELDSDENLTVDGIKELLIAARTAYNADLKDRARKIPPLLLSQLLNYVRNLTLLERRLTPDLYTLVTAAKQTAGDQYALHLAETAATYPISNPEPPPLPVVKVGINKGRLNDGELVKLVSRLPGPPVQWRSCKLSRRPPFADRIRWRMAWNPFSQCSWPPEDEQIEQFRAHLFERARQVIGADLVRTEKFTTSVRDGIDIRETMRHWHDGEIHVRILPRSQGRLDCAVMLFDSPAEPQKYPWRTTWFAEHKEESTLAFFASDYRREPVGPGICLATYGGAMFLFPPLPIPDIWTDPRLDFTETLEERLIAAACLHSACRQIALLSTAAPGAGWRRLARKFRKTLVHVSLSNFSDATIQQLRMVHVLNGREIRSFAAHFIRKS
ncbi:MAG: hypothetical protein FJ295_03090 [Planctomycetes bacterium]|nr:hypothetical protein [Planctomycetota bacterium]